MARTTRGNHARDCATDASPLLAHGSLSIDSMIHRCLSLLAPIAFAGCIVSGDAAEETTAVAAKSLRSFPGAEGFGTTTPGGRGGRVVRVTNLNDSGTGSLRWALTQRGPRTVVFATGGIITLKDEIRIRSSHLTVAGQTAPGDGIVIRGARLSVQASDVIIRGLRFRPGAGPGQDPNGRDGISIGRLGSKVERVVVDHCSMSWAIDENASTWYPVRNITFSNNLIAEALHDSLHPQGPHSKGLLIGGNWFEGAPVPRGTPPAAVRVSVIRNVFAHNVDRNPFIQGINATLPNQSIEVVNNYVYNFTAAGTTVAHSRVHLVNNFYRPGVNTTIDRPPVYLQTQHTSYLRGNLGHYRPTDTRRQADIAHGKGVAHVRTRSLFAGSGVSKTHASHLLEYALANAGARWPRRDRVDTRILNTVKNGTGKAIHRVSQVGGYPSYRRGSPPRDSDRDGIPDWAESALGFDKHKPDHNDDFDDDGYTNLEEYINGLISGFDTAPGKNRRRIALEDSFIHDTVATNFGSDSLLRVKASSGAQFIRRAYIKFRIAGIANTVASVKLRLTVASVGRDVGSGRIPHTVYFVAKDGWREKQLHGNNEPSPHATAQPLGRWTVSRSDVTRTFEIDITDSVRAERSRGGSLLTLEIRGARNVAGARDIYYASTEHGNPSYRPTIVW